MARYILTQDPKGVLVILPYENRNSLKAERQKYVSWKEHLLERIMVHEINDEKLLPS